jgi:hypothetical protein
MAWRQHHLHGVAHRRVAADLHQRPRPHHIAAAGPARARHLSAADPARYSTCTSSAATHTCGFSGLRRLALNIDAAAAAYSCSSI